MKQFLLISLISSVLIGALVLPVASQSPDTLDVLVTPEFVSVTVTGGPVDYGSVPLSMADDSRSTAVGGPITATNTGSVEVDFRIHGSDATSAVAGNSTWTLNCDSPNGLVGADQFVHKFGKNSTLPFDFDAAGSVLCPQSQSAKDLLLGVTPGAATDFVLQIAMPTSTTGFAQRTSQVIVVAVQQ